MGPRDYKVRNRIQRTPAGLEGADPDLHRNDLHRPPPYDSRLSSRSHIWAVQTLTRGPHLQLRGGSGSSVMRGQRHP